LDKEVRLSVPDLFESEGALVALPGHDDAAEIVIVAARRGAEAGRRGQSVQAASVPGIVALLAIGAQADGRPDVAVAVAVPMPAVFGLIGFCRKL
jgi:hypothetical protein